MEENIEVPQSNLAPPPNYEMKVRNYRAYRLVYFTLGFIEAFLALRFFFKLLGANERNFFAICIYGISNLLLLPFSGLFQKATVAGSATAQVFEPSTLIAMIVYALLAWGIGKGILIFKSKPARPHETASKN